MSFSRMKLICMSNMIGFHSYARSTACAKQAAQWAHTNSVVDRFWLKKAELHIYGYRRPLASKWLIDVYIDCVLLNVQVLACIVQLQWTRLVNNTFKKYWQYQYQYFLADRTNDRAIATLLRLSVVCLSSVTLCIVAKRCVLEQKLLWKAYRKSYMRNRLVPKWMTLTFV